MRITYLLQNSIITSIESELVSGVFADLLENTKNIIEANSIATVGFAENGLGIVHNGIKYHPSLIKPLPTDKSAYIPVHRTVISDFTLYLSDNRENLLNFALLRAMISQATSLANSMDSLANLTTIPLSVLSNLLSHLSPIQFTKNSLTPSDCEDFAKRHKKALELLAYYNTFSNLFGDLT